MHAKKKTPHNHLLEGTNDNIIIITAIIVISSNLSLVFVHFQIEQPKINCLRARQFGIRTRYICFLRNQSVYNIYLLMLMQYI